MDTKYLSISLCSSISFSNALWLPICRFFTSFVKIIPRYFILFVAVTKEIFFNIFPETPALVYSNSVAFVLHGVLHVTHLSRWNWPFSWSHTCDKWVKPICVVFSILLFKCFSLSWNVQNKSAQFKSMRLDFYKGTKRITRPGTGSRRTCPMQSLYERVLPLHEIWLIELYSLYSSVPVFFYSKLCFWDLFTFMSSTVWEFWLIDTAVTILAQSVDKHVCVWIHRRAAESVGLRTSPELNSVRRFSEVLDGSLFTGLWECWLLCTFANSWYYLSFLF